MVTEFSRKLALLRKESGISQREAAADLEISQALLSHYENGIREPGLAFVVRVCEYYHVSADFILGRTLDRNGAMLDPDDILQAAESRHILKGSALALLHGKLLTGAISVLFDMLGKLNNRKAVNAAAAALGDAVYRLYRYFYRAAGGNETYFATAADVFDLDAAAADEKLSEVGYVSALQAVKESGGDFPDVMPDALTQNYPGRCQGLTQVLNGADSRIHTLTHLPES